MSTPGGIPNVPALGGLRVPLTGRIGAEIRGVVLSGDLDAAVLAVAIRLAWISNRLGQLGVGVWAASGQKREQIEPVAALVEVEVGNQYFVTFSLGFGEDSSIGVTNERSSVERDCSLIAPAVRHHHEGSVGDAIADNYLEIGRAHV